jgi:hypothetical protein
MTISLDMSLIRKYWPQILIAGTLAYHKLSPELSNLATNHPHVFVYVSAGIVFVATLLKSPLSSSDSGGSSGS